MVLSRTQLNATWAYSYNFSTAVALGDHAVNVIEGKCDVLDFDAIMSALSNSTSGAGWNGNYLVDADGVERENYILIYQDTYVFGKGYLHMTDLEVPEKYLDIQ